ncbi:hypothetical protein MLD38_022748 [Melastoma candidum]|uniref:Uncharacterized protein n=1 Tax=Melastoma candidum TaxID=119954 RepID=A0ACB9QKV9_9MYRT|nr:hypothetical protein MLD38_022748 [Melastoma candidum]
MSDAEILDEEPAPLPGKRKSDAHEVNPPCKTLKTQPLTTDEGEIHVNGMDGDDPERKEENGGVKVESLPENGKDEEEEEDVRASAENEDGEDEDDDEDFDEKKERTEGSEEVVDRKGKGKMAEGERDVKGKGKSVISWDDYEFDSDISLDCEDDDSDSDDSDSDDTELLEMGSDGDLSDDPLAEVDLENILPSRTRHGAAGTRGVFIRGGDRKDAGDGDVDHGRNGDDKVDHTGDGNDDRTGDGDNKGL